MSKTSRIHSLRERLREVEEARRALVANGQAYSIQGSHQVTMPEMKVLQDEERSIRRQILRARGITARANYAGLSESRTYL